MKHKLFARQYGVRDNIFTERQKRVLHLLAQDLTDKEIAEKLQVDLNLLRSNALKSIRNKTNLSELEDIMLYAREHGFGESEAKIC